MQALLLKLVAGVIVSATSALVTLYFHKRGSREAESRLRTSVANPRPLQPERRSRQCGICSEMNYLWECVTLSCNHEFHKECLKLVFSEEVKGNRTCPLRYCRALVNEDWVSDILAH